MAARKRPELSLRDADEFARGVYGPTAECFGPDPEFHIEGFTVGYWDPGDETAYVARGVGSTIAAACRDAAPKEWNAYRLKVRKKVTPVAVAEEAR